MSYLFGGACRRMYFAVLTSLLGIALPSLAQACACGCGIFGVGANQMFPTTSPDVVSLEWDTLDQSQSRSGAHAAPAADNPDKRIRTNFYTLTWQHALDEDWTVSASLPYWQRYFDTSDETSGAPVAFHHGAMGDIRVMATYAGFSADLSSGVSFGVKLPNGDYTYPGFDRDTEIGTGSTDLLLGGYKTLTFGAQLQWIAFVQGLIDQPLATQGGYRPGGEFDTTLGVFYDGWKLPGNISVAPALQLLGSLRARDRGAAADPDNSGYRRLLVAPALQAQIGATRVYVDYELPVAQYFNGNQLASRWQTKLSVSYAF